MTASIVEYMEKKIELLSPAGNTERMIMALHYGADAVYLGGEKYGLRAFSDNFGIEELAEAVRYAHAMDKKVYFTLNVFAHNSDINGMAEYVASVGACGVDGFIISDPGVLRIAKRACPDTPVHISTQANITNYESAAFWHDMGAERVVLARELTLDDIAEIRAKTPSTLELEAFVHGAMCVAYSGRCLVSSFLTGRSGNQGKCTQVCRWDFEIREKGRQGQYLTLSEDSRGSYILNSRDLNMIRHIKELSEAGICSFKIEGRMKTAYYTSVTTRAYRLAIDDYLNGREFDEELYAETCRASHRQYSEGFYFGKPSNYTESSDYIHEYSFIAVVRDYDHSTGEAIIEQRNNFAVGDTIEVLSTDREIKSFTVEEIINEAGESQTTAAHAQQILRIKCGFEVAKYDIWRKKL